MKPKTGNFLTKFFLSYKIVRYLGGFFLFNKDFLRFCVLTLLPGIHIFSVIRYSDRHCTSLHVYFKLEQKIPCFMSCSIPFGRNSG